VRTSVVLNLIAAERRHIERLASILHNKPDFKIYPNGRTGRLHLSVPEGDPDVQLFESYCREHDIRFMKGRTRSYSNSEMDAAPYLWLACDGEAVDLDGTRFTDENACPKCGIGRKLAVPLVIPLGRIAGKKTFGFGFRHDFAWVVSKEVSEALRSCTGFTLGPVCDTRAPTTPVDSFYLLIVENYLRRMATITNFSEYDPPLRPRCECNRAGWNLRDEMFYEWEALRNAKDFNLTVERLYGGGFGINRLLVSQKVRQIFLKDSFLPKRAGFEPVHPIEKDPGTKHKFDLPLDLPASAERGSP